MFPDIITYWRMDVRTCKNYIVIEQTIRAGTTLTEFRPYRAPTCSISRVRHVFERTKLFLIDDRRFYSSNYSQSTGHVVVF